MAIRSSTKQRHKPLVLERSNLVHGPLFSLGKSSSFTGDFPLINRPLAINMAIFETAPSLLCFHGTFIHICQDFVGGLFHIIAEGVERTHSLVRFLSDIHPNDESRIQLPKVHGISDARL